jgi:hypothetical protein
VRFFLGDRGSAVMTADRATHQARARPRLKEAWLVRLVGPGCIRYRECTQVHNIYTVYIYIYMRAPSTN